MKDTKPTLEIHVEHEGLIHLLVGNITSLLLDLSRFNIPSPPMIGCLISFPSVPYLTILQSSVLSQLTSMLSLSCILQVSCFQPQAYYRLPIPSPLPLTPHWALASLLHLSARYLPPLTQLALCPFLSKISAKWTLLPHFLILLVASLSSLHL